MNADEIDKIIAEALEGEKNKKKGLRSKGKPCDVVKVRRVLNVVFMVGALATFLIYFLFPEQKTLFVGVGVGAMILKIIEFGLRFLF